MEFLLSQGADANRANKDGMLPLHIASKKGNYRSAQALPPPPSPHGEWGGHRIRKAQVREEGASGENRKSPQQTRVNA